jgi:DNA (cytosine-5)-methyltransferase 1
MRELALFAGAGGGILGGGLLGWRTVCAVERNAYCAAVLAQRQTDGCLRPFPIWSDVTTFDGRPWRSFIDMVSGGFPCQDISVAGSGVGLDGERSGLWREMARIIREVGPRYVYVENSPMLTSRGLGRVLGDLAELGFDAQWGVLGASDVGAPHIRKRIWILADARSNRYGKPIQSVAERGSRIEADAGRHGEVWSVAHSNGDFRHERGADNSEEEPGGRDADRSGISASMADAECLGRDEMVESVDGGSPDKGPAVAFEHSGIPGGRQGWPTEPRLGRVADGVANRVDRITAIGNGQVPRVAATAWRLLNRRNKR